VGFSVIGMSHLSLKYYIVPVAATKAGASYNPTSDTVQFAFAPTPAYVPQVSDLVTGSWEANPYSLLYPYNAKVLVGPGGAIALGIGTYIVYQKTTDSPEIPFDIVGQLQIQLGGSRGAAPAPRLVAVVLLGARHGRPRHGLPRNGRDSLLPAVAVHRARPRLVLRLHGYDHAGDPFPVPRPVVHDGRRLEPGRAGRTACG